MNSANMLKALVALVLAVALGVGLYIVLNENNGTAPEPNGNGNGTPGAVNFEETGNLVRNNPGMTPDIWHLLYEAPSQAAITIELRFNNDSECVSDDAQETCDPDELTQGARVTVKGKEEQGAVTVQTLTLLDDGDNDHDDLIRVTSPQPFAAVRSPLTIEGEARGTWFFEASFPIHILDANGKELGTVAAEAQDDWMTEDFVPFEATLVFTTPTTQTGTLVLEKDNPSGLPENADELRIPVTFATSERTVKLYYYDADKDRDDDGNVMCSRQGLVAVEREIPVTQTPIQDTIRLLLEGELTSQERAQGLETEYPLDGFELEGADLQDGRLTLEFNDPENQTSGGACRVGVLWHQIEETAKQFPEVQSVNFTPEELFQP